MAVKLAAPFELNSADPNFTRDRFKTLKDMKACGPAVMDVGHISWVDETNSHWVFTNQDPTGEYKGWEPLIFNCMEINLSEDYIIPENPSKYQEIIYYFNTGETPYRILAADGVKWMDGDPPETQPNHTYAVSVLKNLAVWGEF